MSANESLPRIAVDAMGGDRDTGTVVAGAIAALRDRGGFELVLYGDEAQMRAAVSAQDPDGSLPIDLVPCTQNIEMCDSPAAAIRGKTDSPIVRAMKDQREGRVGAVVSAGSTGAMVAASLIILGRLPSVDRPCIATVVPTVDGLFLLLDAGANSICKPAHLVRFAEMGSCYCREMLDVESPRVGLLNIGEEDSKGTEDLVAANSLLRASPLNFVGNVESNRLLLGAADVVVTDGFTGNIVLKQVEGIGRFLHGLTGSETLDPEQRAIVGKALGVLQQRLNYEMYGGALLLGIAGVSIICHGRSSSLAIENAVRVAARQIRLDMPSTLRELPSCIDN